MKKKVVNLMNKEVSEVELPESVFGIKVFPDILHQYILLLCTLSLIFRVLFGFQKYFFPFSVVILYNNGQRY